MEMKAAVLFDYKQPFSIETITLDEPKAGEVRVKIKASGVCHSDYHLMTGDTQHPMPVICGHEGAGIVEAVGEGVTRVQTGDHVILNWTPSCGRCFYCIAGKPTLCETFTPPIWAGTLQDGTNRTHLNGEDVYLYCGLGTHAEYVVVPQEACIAISKDIWLKAASLVGCAVATGVGAVLFTADVRPGASVVVLGCGGVGLNAIQGAALAGAEKIIAVDVNHRKKSAAVEFGATHFLISDNDLTAKIQELTGGRGADFAFEAVGIPALQEKAMEVIRPGGTAVLAGLSPMGTSTNLPGAILTREEKTVKGSYYGTVVPDRDFPRLLQLYKARKLKLDELISHEYSLEQINEAYDDLING
ncbi:MAG: Zn-dependent alcohol dehydrogenase, partial [Chloroflexota bacterium]